MKELDIKLAQFWAWLDQHQPDALLLQDVSSFARTSCGAVPETDKASMIGEVPLYITHKGNTLMGCNPAWQARRSQITNSTETIHQ